MIEPCPEKNPFGWNFPVTDTESACRHLGIEESDHVLEVGGAGNPFPRANVVCDLTFGSCAQRNGAPGVFRDDVTYVEAPAERLPFEDGEFDFVYCTQVLEHVKDPAAACRELSRVARRGFVEMPSRLGELTNGNPSHRWIVDREGEGLVFTPRNFLEHPLANFFYGVLFRDADLRARSEREFRNIFNVQLLFEGTLPCRVEPAAGAAFDYDDPVQAGRAHYDFARNTLSQGVEASYAYPDAVEAVRLLPGSVPAKLLLAGYQVRLLRPGDALALLEGLEDGEARALRSLIERVAKGERLDPASFPLPGPEPLTTSCPAPVRPLVSVVVAGSDGEAVLEAARSALTQDYPRVEVLVATRGPAPAAFARMQMGDRLELFPGGEDDSLGACLNRAALASRGAYVGFVLGGDRHLAHHVDRMVSHLAVTGGAAVHGDRMHLSGEGIVGPDIQAGNPASSAASLSTLVARRDLLEEVGAFREEAGEGAPFEYLLRVARTGRLQHVREVTVAGSGPLPSGAEALDEARASARLQPMELLRDLMAAYTREQGLRARIRELETQPVTHDGTPS